MTMPSWMSGPPKTILLATDLSARCDRALDRATALAVQWKSGLAVLHVIEQSEHDNLNAEQLPSWRRSLDPVDIARKEVLTDVHAVADRVRVMIREGDPVEAILRTADTEVCALIVIGIAKDDLLGRIRLGRTVDRLMRRSRVPLLIVKNRPRRAYRHIVVATDFSESSRHALEAAARFFSEQRVTVFHAYDAPMSGLMTDSASYRREYRNVALRECEAFLETVDKPPTWQAPEVLIEDGSPTFLLCDYVRQKEVDLVVFGTHGRSAVFDVLLGSVAKTIMDHAPCDALIVREPRATIET